MSQFNSSQVIRLATIKPFESEQDTFVRNIDGTVMRVHDAPVIRALSQGLGVPFEIVISDSEQYGNK